MRKVLLTTVILVLCGACQTQVPTSEIWFGNVRAKLPKDSEADELTIIAKVGTNSFTFKAVKWSTKNNPSVINASADQIRAHYEGAAAAVAKGMEAGAKGASPVP